jgi:hypothetical protein
MQIRMDRKDAIPIVEWEHFLTTARRAGATDDTTIEEETSHLDPETMIGYTIDVERDEESDGPETVTIPAWLLHDLLFVARDVATSDGDVRGLEVPARRILDRFHDHFLAPVIGPNPWLSDENDKEEEPEEKEKG